MKRKPRATPAGVPRLEDDRYLSEARDYYRRKWESTIAALHPPGTPPQTPGREQAPQGQGEQSST